MAPWTKWHWTAALPVGIVAGLAISGLWPSTPLHAVSTDRTDTYIMATGPVDGDVEAVYLLDTLTGDLGAFVLGKQTRSWTGAFQCNVAADMGVDPQRSPKYLLVTGVVGLRKAGGTRQQPSNAACYVAEVSSGKLAAYVIPWSPPMYASGQMQTGRLALVGATRFRQPLGGGEGPIATPKGREKE